MGSHIVNGQFKSDKYEWCPAGFVPLKITDKTAQAELWAYAQTRRVIDPEFADDLETALRAVGYTPPTVAKVADLIASGEDAPLPLSVIPNYMGINLCSVDAISWVRQPDQQLVTLTIHFIPATPEREHRR